MDGSIKTNILGIARPLNWMARLTAPIIRAAYGQFAGLPKIVEHSLRMGTTPDRLVNFALGYGSQVERLTDLHARGVTLTDVDLNLLGARKSLEAVFAKYGIDLFGPMKLPPQYVIDENLHPMLLSDVAHRFTKVKKMDLKGSEAARREKYGYGNNDKLLQALLVWIQAYPTLAPTLIDAVDKSFEAIAEVGHRPEWIVPFLYTFITYKKPIEVIQMWAAADPNLVNRFVYKDYPDCCAAIREARANMTNRPENQLSVIPFVKIIGLEAWMVTAQEFSIDGILSKDAVYSALFYSSEKG